MDNDNPSILSHVSIGSNDFERVVSFYDQVLPTIGCRQIMVHAGAVAFSKAYPEFWVQGPLDSRAATVGNGTHAGFVALTKDAVHAFDDAALASGAKDEGTPGTSPGVWRSLHVFSSAISTVTRSRLLTGIWRWSKRCMATPECCS